MKALITAYARSPFHFAVLRLVHVGHPHCCGADRGGTQAYAARHGLAPFARILAMATASVDPA